MRSTRVFHCLQCLRSRLQTARNCSSSQRLKFSQCSNLNKITVIQRHGCASYSVKSDGYQFTNSDSQREVPNQSKLKIAEDYDWEYLLSPSNSEHIQHNIDIRKGLNVFSEMITKVKEYEEKAQINRQQCIERFSSSSFEEETAEQRQMRRDIFDMACFIPNKTHPQSPIGEESECQLLDTIGSERDFDFKTKGVVELGEKLHSLRTEPKGLSKPSVTDFQKFDRDVGTTTGHKSYYFLRDFAKLQDALVNYTLDTLSEHGFRLVYVPEAITPSIIEGCGFPVSDERSQVFSLVPCGGESMALAGTGEMPLAGLLAGRTIPIHQLPLKMMTVSKCYRAEVAEGEREKGIYRVHQFTKVEMFGVASGMQESENLFQQFVSIQKQLFTQLGLHFRVLNMSTEELGTPAHCKYDMEAWMCHKRFWGEISSTSNCTDFQSRRLGIRCSDEKGNTHHAHTVNGTACAVPRLIMALAEQFQTKDAHIQVPAALQSYMHKSVIETPKRPPHMQPIRVPGESKIV